MEKIKKVKGEKLTSIKSVEVEVLKELNVPGERTKQIGAKMELPESSVKILESGENPSVKRVSTNKIKSTTGEEL